jgi:hypothetical protein
MPTRMKVHSMMRAATYPTARISFSRLRIGNGTTAVPMFAMMSSNSRNAPKEMRLSELAPAT